MKPGIKELEQEAAVPLVVEVIVPGLAPARLCRSSLVIGGMGPPISFGLARMGRSRVAPSRVEGWLARPE